MAVEFVGIELKLRGADKVEDDLKEIDALLNSFNGRRKVDVGMDKLREDIVKARGELEKFQRKREEYLKAGGKGNAFSKEIKEARNNLKDLQQAQREVQSQTRQMGRTFTQEMNSISSRVAHVGSAMQSMGNALVRLSSPFTRITTGLLYGAGYKVLNTFTEGFSNAFERYDIMMNYARSLQAFGFEASEAEEQVKKLEQAVIGLPTGLDEIVAAQKVYVGATNDLEKSTNLAIAANNTFLASGMGSREQRFMQKYLVALGSGANLAATQWDSMARIAPLAMRSVAEALDYADVASFTKDLKNGKVAVEDFLDAFIKVGTEGEVQQAANVLKMTFGSLSANIQNATKRMGAAIIDSLDEVFKDYNGRSLLQTLLGFDAEGNDLKDGIKDWINDLSLSVQNWIKSHPEEIIDFFETLKGIDWKGLLKGLAQGMGDMLQILERFADFMSNKDLSKVGRFMVWANAVGKGLLILGGIVKGSRGIIGFLGALGKFFGKGGVLGGEGGSLGGTMLGAGIGKGTFLGVGKIGLLAAEITGIVGAVTAMATGFAALDMKFLSSAFNSFKKITENLKVGLDNISQIKASDIDMNGVKDLVKKVSEVYQTLSGIPMSVSVSKRMASSTEHIRNAIWQLRRAAYQINQAAGTTVDSGGFATFVEQIKTALEELNNLSQTLELDIKVTLGAGFASSVKGVVKQITDAKTKIENALKKIPTAITRNVSVTITATVNARQAIDAITAGASAVKGAVPLPKAMGGVVYRAKGGGVPFKRRGTDTVPAMLTPGEYVHNKRAVSAFGIDFMRKVNNLDMKGAMNELMHRAGHMANINRGTSITNNYNNNQKVVINNSNAGAGYTFKTASRFVGAF